MAVGWLVGVALRAKPQGRKWVETAVLVSIFLLLFFMGLGIGSNQLLVKSLPTLGLNAMIIAIGATFGSVIMGWIVWKLVFSSSKKS